MNIDEFKRASKEQLIEYGKTIKLGSTYDSNNNELTFRDSTGYWYEKTYDSNNNELTYKDSNGYTFEYTYNSNNILLTFKNSNGYWDELICSGKVFNLMYDKNKKVYRAGCKELNYKDCIEFFNTEGKDYIDAELFMKTIHQNELDIVT